MTAPKNKLHIPNLKSLIARAFAEAKDHCEYQFATLDEGWPKTSYLSWSREYGAGLEQIDELVSGEKFTSERAAKECRCALRNYQRMLDSDLFPFQAREIGHLVEQVDAALTANREQHR